MSDYTAIADFSLSLRELLRTYITLSTLPQLAGVQIDLRSPKEMREANVTGVSLWLYRIIRNSDLLNRPRRHPTPTQIERPGLPINLHYLVTPIAQNSIDEQALMGRVLQIINDYATLGGANLLGTLENSGLEFRVTLEPMILEDITRVWNSLQEPYQLSVSFEVTLITIDSQSEPDGVQPVLVKEADYLQIVGEN